MRHSDHNKVPLIEKLFPLSNLVSEDTTKTQLKEIRYPLAGGGGKTWPSHVKNLVHNNLRSVPESTVWNINAHRVSADEVSHVT